MNSQTKLVVLFCVFTTACGLSCYKCYSQNWNDDCIIKRAECLEFQDTCTSYISWHISKDAGLSGERRQHIYKGCDTRTGCKRRQGALRNHCGKRGYTFDWACVECCEGDLCNYEIHHSSSAQITASFVTLLLGVVASAFFNRI